MDSHDDAWFDALIERSSLGTAGARRLRERTPRAQADAVRQIIDLRNRMVHSLTDKSAAEAAMSLIQLLRDLGYEGQAERVLTEAFPGREVEVVVHLAQAISRYHQERQQPGVHADAAGGEAEPAGSDEAPAC
ncbi:hypothetical protein TH66_00715 [Carbonactinospora thermoautotrophica]|uniref:Uncharacterized protein n=1 Tax=Carbonactinospora thermoautotrophica TaxID=1469144 RepID=A0A132NBM2_9ACTN|nr:hypothetical protein [Carbonactinospora thermoautotrophica]KWX05879.1 hypothetical protein TH66_00715 [Carbonactinospora thermoautotrophica]KWX07396.1 hypothetical protein TR74_18960 [Carbonactinospora thermoautotrophica]